MKKKGITLVEGSKYKITSVFDRDEPMITRGTFRGYTMVGEVDAICIEMDESHHELTGKLRIIPTPMILAIDIITMAEEKKTNDENLRQYVG